MNKETKALHQAIHLTSRLHIASEALNRMKGLTTVSHNNECDQIKAIIDGVADQLPDTIVMLFKPTAKRKNRSV